MAAFTYEALAAAPAGWTSPEFEGREAGFEQIVNAGAVMNRLRQFDWMREEINPEASTGVAAGNQAGASARKESTSTRPRSFTGGMSGGGEGVESVSPRLAAVGPGRALDPDDLNLYAYLANNPFAGTDPDGRGAIWDAAKAVAKKGFSVLTGETSAGDLVRAAPGAAVGAVKASAEWMDQHPRFAAGLQIAQGAGEVLGGMASTGTGVGAIPGALLMAHGADSFFTGINSLISGKTQATLTQKLLEGASESLTGEKAYGTIATVGLDLAASGLAARNLARAGGLLKTTGNALPEERVTATKLGTRRLPEGDNPWIKYQAHVTGRRYEEMWTANAERVGVDARRADFTVEAKWTGRNDAAWKSSPYNPRSRYYDEPEILDQARRLIQLHKAVGGKGVRYAVSNPAAQNHFERLFLKHFPDENIKVWHVPGTGMR